MSLKDQMLKAGLITEKEARQVTHTTRVDDKKAGHKQRERKVGETRREVKGQRDAERARHREQGRAQAAERASSEAGLQAGQQRESAIAAAYREGLVGKWEGPRRYYFARNGRVEYMMVTDDVGRCLELGQTAIAAGEKNSERLCLITAGAARKLKEVAPERIMVFFTP